MNTKNNRRARSGNVLILSAFTLIALVAIVACAVDLGYIYVVRGQLQNNADAAALAAAWELIDEDALTGQSSPYQRLLDAELKADQCVALNNVASAAPALGVGDMTIGYLADPTDPNCELTFNDPSTFNAIRIRVRRTAQQNGGVGLFFARALGMNTASQEATATAMFYDSFKGFQAPSNGENLNFLPIALDEPSWNDLVDNRTGPDTYAWNKATGEVNSGGDNIKEIDLYPQATGSPGNRGTVDVGSNNNSTAVLSRQILYGITVEDLAYHGGKLELDEDGELLLNADTGLSAGIKDELAAIIGRPTVIPIFRSLSGNGNNAYYTIIGFGGIRILDVKLTGNNKYVMVQPCNVDILGGIPDAGGNSTDFIVSPVRLVR